MSYNKTVWDKDNSKYLKAEEFTCGMNKLGK